MTFSAGSAGTLSEELAAEMRAAGRPERAEGSRAYLKSDLEFFGASVPAIRNVLTGLSRRFPDLRHDDLTALAEALWSQPVFERRLAAILLLELYAPLLRPTDITLVERLLRESRTWALVDPLATDVVGTLAARHPEVGAVLDRWVGDGDFWIRRAALLALLVPLRQGGGDPDRFFRYADRLLDEREFFIRKAIGWVLRDMGKRRPGLVRDWLAPRAGRASGVTMREAVKYLDAADRDALMAAYRAGRTGGTRTPGS